MEKNIFLLGIFQKFLLFISAKKYIKYFSGTTRIESYKSHGISEESIENITNQAAILHILLIIIYYQIWIYMDTV